MSGGLPVLVLHAAGLDAESARFLGLPGMVSLTLPGHGRRARPRPGLSLRDMADEVAGWLRGPVDVVGLSMGGMVAQHLALSRPDLVRSLVLACTTACPGADAMLARATATENDDRDETVRTTLERWFTSEALGPDPLAGPLSEPVAYARECLRTIDLHAFADVWRAVAGHDVTDRLAEITAPTTCLAGSSDVSTPPATVAALAAGLPRARLVRIDAPHMAPLEQPGRFRDVVLDHLAWVNAAAPTAR